MSDRRIRGQRRSGPKDRRVIQTPGHPLRRFHGTGRRSDDQAFTLLPRKKQPSKPTLKERIETLRGVRVRPNESFVEDALVSRGDVLDLLKEYGVEDA
jgi:hypothetical protein